MDWSIPGFTVLFYLPEFAQTHVHWVDSGFQSSHLCHSLLLLPSLSWHQGLECTVDYCGFQHCFAGHQWNSPLDILLQTCHFNARYVQWFLVISTVNAPCIAFPILVSSSFILQFYLFIFFPSQLRIIIDPPRFFFFFFILHIKINEQIFKAVPSKHPEVEYFWPGTPLLYWFRLSLTVFWTICIAS